MSCDGLTWTESTSDPSCRQTRTEIRIPGPRGDAGRSPVPREVECAHVLQGKRDGHSSSARGVPWTRARGDCAAPTYRTSLP